METTIKLEFRKGRKPRPNPWVPHGLVHSHALSRQYARVHRRNRTSGSPGLREAETVSFVENVLKTAIFTGSAYKNVRVYSQRSPDDGLWACDLVVSAEMPAIKQTRTICFVECKRTLISSEQLIAAERQALRYCKAHLSHTGRSKVFAATVTGAHVRLWSYTTDHAALTPLWPSTVPDQSTFADYKDFGVNTDGELIQKTFRDMLNLAEPSKEELAAAHIVQVAKGKYQDVDCDLSEFTLATFKEEIDVEDDPDSAIAFILPDGTEDRAWLDEFDYDPSLRYQVHMDKKIYIDHGASEVA